MKTFIALSVMLASAAAIGDDRPAKNPEAAQAKFESLDRNKDQALSKAEASEDASLNAQFASLDADADGYVSKSEYVAKMTRSSREPYQQ